MCEHLGISALTGTRVKCDDDSAIQEYLLFYKHIPDFEDFSILTTKGRIQGLVWGHWCYKNVGFVYTNNTLWSFKQTWAADPGILKVFNPTF